MNKIVFFLILPFFVLSQQDNFYEILEQDDFKENINKEGRLLFDIRTMEEFNLGHIEGAINIDYYEQKLFLNFFNKIEKSKPIYIYCRSGNRSRKSSEILKKLGFAKVYDLKGGYKNWVKSIN